MKIIQLSTIQETRKQQQTQRKVEIEIKAKVGVDKYGDNKNPTKLIKPKDCSLERILE